MTDFSQPQEVDDVLLAFPADVMHLMPDPDDCEDALDALPREEEEKWRSFQRKWFFNGLPENTKVDLKDGIDGDTAFRHLGAIQGSFQPKHEHKEAAVAYLASLWFEDVDYGD
jgi:hypothetical protein